MDGCWQQQGEGFLIMPSLHSVCQESPTQFPWFVMMFKLEEKSHAVNLLYNQGQVILAASWIAMISIKANGLTLTLVLEHQCLKQSLLQSYNMASR
jgi:hypothetical protein